MAVETVAEHEIEDLTAGQRLKAAREAHQLDRNEIARWLKLDEKFIKAIEEDDEEHLPQPVFIAGYIRSYAKLVDLPSDQLVKEFNKTHQIPEPKITKPPEAVPGRMSKVAESLPKRFSVAANSHPAKVKWMVMGSLGIFAVGVIGWAVVLLKGSNPEIAALKEPQNISTLPSPTNSGAAPSADVDNNSLVADNANPQTEATEAGSQPEQVPKRITVPLPLNKLPLSKKERSDPGVVSALAEEQLATNQRLENIALHFSADSWVDIRDATGKRLLRSLGVAGATKEVQGVAPFQVLIGYGPGVELKYNGEPYDFSQHQGKQEVARFTLNPTDSTNRRNAGGQDNDINQ